MRKVIERYIAKFDELHRYVDGISESLPETGDEFLSDSDDWLIDAYLEGFASAGYILGDDIDRQPDPTLVEDSVDRVIEGRNTNDRLAEYYQTDDIDSVRAVLDTEYHRNWVQGALDRAKEAGAQNKIWVTVRDNRVRENHKYIDGIKLPIDGEFVTLDGDVATAPGMFSKAQNNVSCRCILDFE